MPAPRKTKTTHVTPVNHEICWAKTLPDGSPGISVRDHCLNVGCVAEVLMELLPAQLQALLPKGAATLAALHDVGKVSPGFQAKCDKWLDRHRLTKHALDEGWGSCEKDHAKTSQYTVQQRLGQSNLYPWAAIIGAHHGRIKGERVQLTEPWEEERCRLMEELVKEFGSLPDQQPDEAILWFVAGLITTADWIGSDENHFPQNVQEEMAARREHAQDALMAIGWKRARIKNSLSFRDIFLSIPQPNSVQVTASQAVRHPGFYIIEAPMGYGKTEAALAAAYKLLQSEKATGLYFALPSQVTSNRIYIRLQEFINQISSDPEQVQLTHGNSWLVDPEPLSGLNPTCHAHDDNDNAQEHLQTARSWFTSTKRALLAPFGVGTVDQALLGIVAAKHFFLRQFGLAGKIVILDEVHTYDLYTSTLIDTLIRRLRELQCTVIVLSATLTEKRRRGLLGLSDDHPISAAYPLVSTLDDSLTEWPCDPPPARDIHVRCNASDGWVGEALERARRGECVLWIRNTVDAAQETYRALKSSSAEDGPVIALLHARFPFFRREELEAEWMNKLGKDSALRPAGCVLVSTQVVEQSVDIDADVLITDLAPTDMLLQRLGRLWRHERPNRLCDRPEVWIQISSLSNEALRNASAQELREALGKSASVYAPYVLLRSLQEWRERTSITLPTDIRPILEATYADTAEEEPEAWGRLREQLEKQRDKMTAQARNATMIWANPALADEEGVQTRYGDYPMAQLLLLREWTRIDSYTVFLRLLNGETVDVKHLDWDFKAAKAIHRNLVRVPRWAIASQLENRSPAWLTHHVHQPTAVGLLQADGSIRGQDGETQWGLSYHAEQGVIINRKDIPRISETTDESYD